MDIFSSIRNRVVLLVFLLTYGLLVYWYMGTYQTRMDFIHQLEGMEQSLTASNAESRAVLAAIPVQQIEAAITEYREQAERVASLVSEDVTSARVLESLNELALQNGVEVTNITPVNLGAQRPFTVTGFNLSLRGYYHDVAAYITDLLSQPQITQVHDVKVRAASAAESRALAGPGLLRDAPDSGGPDASATHRMVLVTLQIRAFRASIEDLGRAPVADSLAAQGGGK